MSPHENKYKKTRDGYILAVVEILEKETGGTVALPLAYHRVSIDDAFHLWEVAKKAGFAGLQNEAGKMGLPLIPIQKRMI
jgi:hypothetical protein